MFRLSVWVLSFVTNLKKKHSGRKLNLNKFIITSEIRFVKLLSIQENQANFENSDNFNNFKASLRLQKDSNHMQWTLYISTTFYIELLSISNKKLGPLNVWLLSKLFLSLCLKLLHLKFFSISNKNFGPLRLLISLCRTFSRLRVHLHSK